MLKKIFLIFNCISTRVVNPNFNIQDCLISEITSSPSGGAIYVNTMLNLFISDTTFYKCISTSGNGGAIYFFDGLHIKLNKICALLCKNNYQQFAYIKTIHNQTLFLVTISKCYNEPIKYTTVGLEDGIQDITNNNITYNNNIWASCIWIYIPISLKLNLCTFYNNTANSDRGFHLKGTSGTIYKTNIINNYIPLKGIIYVENNGIYNLVECIFINNYITLFHIESGSLNLLNCYYLSGTSSSIGTINNNLVVTITIEFTHDSYNTFYCSGKIYTKIMESTRNNLKQNFNSIFNFIIIIISFQ